MIGAVKVDFVKVDMQDRANNAMLHKLIVSTKILKIGSNLKKNDFIGTTSLWNRTVLGNSEKNDLSQYLKKKC